MTPEPDCFADEIAIDFPSVDDLVQRVRRAFLASDAHERSEPLVRHLCLSSDEAYRGTVVPLELALRDTCEACGGRGGTWLERCDACAGNGDQPVSRWLAVTVPPRVVDGTELHFRVRAPHDASVRVQVRVAVTA
jgi:hypothetical protein